ncbi:MAG: M24 family metallopeptidase [Verrucomicrobia bacterium]|nr:M24 family metallopeptidase [Verrucomicrobiota bacterium]MBU4366272.1 M24 family metallopeptidase [Verrucomicrobiota bacterium]
MGKQLTGAILAMGSPQTKPDIRYRVGFSVPDPVVYVQQASKKYLVVSLLDRELARRVAPDIQVYSPDALRIPRALRGALSGWIVGLLRELGIRTVTVAADFPVRAADQLRRAGLRLFVADGPLVPERAIKTRAEVGRITACQRAAVQAMRAAIRLIARARVDKKNRLRVRGRLLTSERVRRAIYRVLVDHNCTGEGTIVACDGQAATPHGIGHGPLRAHQSIVIDIFPRHLEHGYWGDLTRTVVKGTPSPALKKMYAAVKAAQAAALAKIRAGVSGRRVHLAAVAALARHGFKTGLLEGKAQGFIHSTGHGIGLEVHEAPSLSLRPGRLRAGHVVTVEPGLYYFQHGGVRIEDTVLVTRGGYRKLASCADIFQV